MKQSIIIGLIVATLAGSIVAIAGGQSGQQQGKREGQLEVGVAVSSLQSQAGSLEVPATGRLVKRAASGESGGEHSAVSLESFMKGDLKQREGHNKDAFGEFIKLILNPVELARRVASAFKLDFDKLTAVVGKNLLFGLEAAFAPVVVSMKLVEKVFVPDACGLKFVCSMGTHLSFMKANVLRLSSKTLEGSIAIKALGDGIIGRDCEAAYPSCANNMLTVQKQVRQEASLSGGAALLGSVSGGAGDQQSDNLLAGLVGQQYERKDSNQELLGRLSSMVNEQLGGGASGGGGGGGGGQSISGQKQQSFFGLA